MDTGNVWNKILQKHSVPVTENCSYAHRAERNGKKVGTIGDIGWYDGCE